MYAVLVEFIVSYEQQQAFETALKDTLGQMMEKEPGLVFCELSRDGENLRRYLSYEVYENPEARKDHQRQPHLEAFRAKRVAAGWCDPPNALVRGTTLISAHEMSGG
jgi:quinol monooxygenase YgiN